MNSETKAYQHAHWTWENFRSRYSCPEYDDESLPHRVATESIFNQILRALPPVERTPAAIGWFVRGSRNWSTGRRNDFLEEFLPSPSLMVSDLLNAAANGEVIRPHTLPVTLEEFPSRIWHRALASRSPERLLGAAYLALHAMLGLIGKHEENTEQESLIPYWMPSGDIPNLIDLAALPPAKTYHLKYRIFEQLKEKFTTFRYQPSFKDLDAIQAWILSNSEYGPPLLEKLVAEIVATVEDRDENGELCDPCHTRRLGCLMFRFGKRRLAYQCAKALGDSPWKKGWQFQVVTADVHSRIRKITLGPKGDSTAWLEEPALACSAMSIPLWLVDGTARVEELVILFNRAEECPWIFPRLQHIYQWHLAIDGKLEALCEIEQSNPNLAIGLSKGADAAWLSRE